MEDPTPVRTCCALTPAQVEILQAVYDREVIGSNELGDVLFRSHHTIDSELKEAFDRTGIHDRGLLTIHAQKQGWLRQSPECPGCARVRDDGGGRRPQPS